MTLTHQLYEAAAPVWRQSLAHPFVRSLGDGSLPLENFRFYMRQDYVFLIEYSRLVALAAAKAPSLDTMARFATLLDATLNQEMALHREFATECGITAEEFLEAMDWAEEAGLTNLDRRSRANRAVFRRYGRG